MGGRGDRSWGQISVSAKQTENKFEFDENKSNSNKEKHGIDFKEAQALWNDEKRVKFSSPYKEEPRELTVAKYSEKMYVAVTTMRENRIRIISVRRATDYEVKIYEAKNNDG